MDHTIWYEKIDDYLDGLLTDAERAGMDDALAQDPALARELRLHRAEREALELLSDEKARADFMRWTTEAAPDNKPPDRRPWWRRLWWLPVFAVVVVGLAVWGRQYRTPAETPAATPLPAPSQMPPPADSPAPILEKPAQPVAKVPNQVQPKTLPPPAADFDTATEEVFAAVDETRSLFSEPDASAMRSRSGGNSFDPESPFAKGLLAFEAADYRQAVEWLAQVDSTKNLNLAISATYIQGHAWFRMQQYEKAANAFRFVFQQNKTLFTTDAKWKEALCLYAAFGAELRQKTVVLSACQSGTGSCGKYYDRLRESLRRTVENYPAQAQKAGELLKRLEK